MRFFFLAVALAAATSCSHYNIETSHERGLIFSGQPEAAIESLKQKSTEPGRNQLLYLLDLGMAYHAANRPDDAIKAFLAAEKIAELKDFTSITEETGTLLVTDNVKNYKGEDFEKVLINVYLALSFLKKGDMEGALVECRKVNSLLYRLINEGKRPYNLNALAYYLSGVAYEMNREPNSAYIDYKSVHKTDPKFQLVGADLLEISKKLGFTDQQSAWEKKFSGQRGLTPGNPTGRKDLTQRNGYADVVVLLELGRAPQKVPHPSFQSLPAFQDVPYGVAGANVVINGKTLARTVPIYNVRDIAFTNLNHRIGAMTAKKVAGMAAKAAVGYGIAAATDNKDLGILVGYLLMAADQADLRSWATLPAEFQIARLALPVGKHVAELQYVDARGGVVGSASLGDLQLKGGHHILKTARVAQ